MKKVIKKKPASLGKRRQPTPAIIKANWEREGAGELLNNPPVSFQPECLTEDWCGVAVPWLNRVEERFNHQERRAAAMEVLETKGGTLRGESTKWAPNGAQMVEMSHGPRQIAVLDIDPDKNERWNSCPHDKRFAELVQMCPECNLILKHDERVMIEPARYESLKNMETQWHKLGLYIRQNYQREIERGEHAGVSDADVVIGYLSRGKS